MKHDCQLVFFFPSSTNPVFRRQLQTHYKESSHREGSKPHSSNGKFKKNAITISERKLYLKDRYFHLFVHGFTEQSAAHDTAKSQL